MNDCMTSRALRMTGLFWGWWGDDPGFGWDDFQSWSADCIRKKEREAPIEADDWGGGHLESRQKTPLMEETPQKPSAGWGLDKRGFWASNPTIGRRKLKLLGT